jgi:type II secretory pathway pseudopilin PulG
MLNRSKKSSNRQTLKQKKLLIGLGFATISLILYSQVSQHTKAARLENELQKTQQQVQYQLDTLQKKDNKTLEQQKTIENLDKTNKELEKKLQAKLSIPKVYAESTPKPSQVASTNCGDNQYKSYIYSHESGCRTTALNSIGCRGIGQACPGTKLPCGDDFACQDAYFSNYAVTRYGSWEKAYNFWLTNHWW